jgi:hypothetical protein
MVCIALFLPCFSSDCNEWKRGVSKKEEMHIKAQVDDCTIVVAKRRTRELLCLLDVVVEKKAHIFLSSCPLNLMCEKSGPHTRTHALF